MLGSVVSSIFSNTVIHEQSCTPPASVPLHINARLASERVGRPAETKKTLAHLGHDSLLIVDSCRWGKAHTYIMLESGLTSLADVSKGRRTRTTYFALRRYSMLSNIRGMQNNFRYQEVRWDDYDLYMPMWPKSHPKGFPSVFTDWEKE